MLISPCTRPEAVWGVREGRDAAAAAAEAEAEVAAAAAAAEAAAAEAAQLPLLEIITGHHQ